MFLDACRSLFCKISPRFKRARLIAAPLSLNRLSRALIAAALMLIATLVLPPFASLAQKTVASNPTADLPSGPMQAKATTSCLECHEARIILQQRLGKAAWTKEVDKMTKWGAVVDPADRDALIDYLSTNFSPDKPAYEPPRTALAKSGKISK